MKILFAGTPEIAVPSLEALIASPGTDVVAVLTNPDRPVGRGRRIEASPVKQKALEAGLRVYQPEKPDEDFYDVVRFLRPDLLVVFAYGQIFPEDFLLLFPKGGINIHPSLLPRWRGPSPIQAAVLNRDRETGFTIQTMVKKMDAGDILYRETVLLSGKDTVTGSCRSISGVNIHDALSSCERFFSRFGGHAYAAGLTMQQKDIDEFRAAMDDYLWHNEPEEKFIPSAQYDFEMELGGITKRFAEELSMLEPFGAGNPQPCFGLFGVRIDDIASVSDGKHIRISVSKNGARTGVVYFGMQDKRFPFDKGDTVDLAVNLDRNVYNGETRVSVIVRGIRPSATDEDKVLSAISLFERFSRGEHIGSEEAKRLLPDRALEVEVFRSIKAKPLRDKYCEALCSRLGDDGERLAAISATVDIMLEMGVLTADEYNTVSVPQVSQKVNLEDSAILRRIRSFI